MTNKADDSMGGISTGDKAIIREQASREAAMAVATINSPGTGMPIGMTSDTQSSKH